MSTTPAMQAGRWHTACLYAGNLSWAVVRDIAQPGTLPGGPGLYQREAAPGAYATHEQAQEVATALNRAEKPAADEEYCCAGCGQPYDWCDCHDYDAHSPHPWDLQ